MVTWFLETVPCLDSNMSAASVQRLHRPFTSSAMRPPLVGFKLLRCFIGISWARLEQILCIPMWLNICGKICGIYLRICICIYNIWYDIIYHMIWYDMIYNIWYVICDMIWYDILYMIYYIWYIIYDMWYVIRDTWYVIRDMIWYDIIWYDTCKPIDHWRIWACTWKWKAKIPPKGTILGVPILEKDCLGNSGIYPMSPQTDTGDVWDIPQSLTSRIIQ